jgi:RHS repeat-associated protein
MEYAIVSSNVYLRARWYNAGAGSFGSRDPFAGVPETPYSQHYFQYGYANPVSNTDPSGECPTPPARMGKHVICMALFIKPAEVAVKFTNICLHGDNRGFSNNSDPRRSRGYIWINADTGVYEAHMNPTGYSFSAPAPICTVPVNEDGSFGAPQLQFTEKRSAFQFFEPSLRNIWKVHRSANRSIHVTYDLLLSGPLEEAAPHINGTIVFYRDRAGKLVTHGTRDGFPWAEAYYHTGGTVRTLFQRNAVRGDPEDLNAIEGAYRHGWVGFGGGLLGYTFREKVLADPNPRKDVFGYPQKR